MNTRNIVMIVVGALVLVGAVAGLVYGIATHTEPGLMETTPGFGRDDSPIAVCADSYADDDAAARAATLAAAQTVNDRLGFAAYRFVDSYNDTGCRVHVTVGVPTEAGWRDPGGDATFSNGGRACDVTTSNVPTDDYLSLVLQHELGHCLGLAHDCWNGSVMCGGECCTLEPAPAGAFPPRIDDFDRELLRTVFGR
jgi:hypothetical protein